METNQPTASIPPVNPSSATTGMFGTKMPSLVAYVVGVLLFFMPFVDIKCNNMSLQKVSGFQLATGFSMKNGGSNNSLMDGFKNEKVDDGITKAATKTDKKDPNLFALIALGLGILGLALSLTNAKAAIGGAMVTGIASAGALIGLMLDIKKKAKLDMSGFGDTETGSGGGLGMGKIGISVDFTPWFYLAVIAFLAAAFFCYKRMQVTKT